MKSWKTTVGAVMLFITLAWSQVQYSFDTDPETITNWGVVFAELLAAIGLGSARDNNVSSEDAGAKS